MNNFKLFFVSSRNDVDSLRHYISLFLSSVHRQEIPAVWRWGALQGSHWGPGQGWELQVHPVQVLDPQRQTQGGEEALGRSAESLSGEGK